MGVVNSGFLLASSLKASVPIMNAFSSCDLASALSVCQLAALKRLKQSGSLPRIKGRGYRRNKGGGGVGGDLTFLLPENCF